MRSSQLLRPVPTRLGSDAPALHRLAHFFTAGMVRGGSRMWRLAQRMHALPDAGTVIIGGVSVQAPSGDTRGGGLYLGAREPHVLALLPLLVPRGGFCVDVGAHVGLYSFTLAQLVGPQGTVLAYEPSREHAERLESLSAGHSLPVTVVRAAAGRQSSEALLSIPESDTGLATLREDAVAADNQRRERVPVVSLDDELRPAGGEISLLKLDTEGWESEVIAGASEILAAGRVVSLVVEVSPEFGSTEFAGELVARMGATHACFRVSSRSRRLRHTPCLIEVDAASAIELPSQWTLLAVRRDVVAALPAWLW